MVPFHFIGNDACFISFAEIEEKFIKTNLLADQSLYVHCQLQELLKIIEKDVDSSSIQNPGVCNENKMDKKEVLRKLIRVFINFSFIRNVFEIDCNEFSLEYHCFTLKDSLIY